MGMAEASAAYRLDPTGLAENFRRRAHRAPERPALTFGSEAWSYGETQQRAERLSAVLAAGGVGPGDRVAYVGFNHPVVIEGVLAAARLGAIFVLLNFRCTAPELEFMINDAGVHTLLAGPDHTAVIDATRASLVCSRYLAIAPAAGWEGLGPLMDEAGPVPDPHDADGDDLVLLMYTSGTTGTPKGAMLSNHNLWTNHLNWMLSSDFSSTEVGLNCAPLFHVGGMCVVVLPVFFAGGHVVLEAAFDPGGFLRAVERHRVTATFCVPAMMLAMSRDPAFATADLSSLRLVVAGGAPVPEPLLRLYGERGIPVSQCYGMTEATAAVTLLDTGLAMERLGSCGRAGMLNDVCVVDFDGKPVTEAGVKGEVCMRGANVTRVYWNQPEATAETIDSDGWLHSGDVGYFDAGGFLYLCDRVKDMIITGGENVYPAEVESRLFEHPAIAEVAVIGAPDEKWGERVVAVAALNAGAALTLEELDAFASASLARYKVPKVLHVVDVLPRNANGKVVKTELRERFGAPA